MLAIRAARPVACQSSGNHERVANKLVSVTCKDRGVAGLFVLDLRMKVHQAAAVKRVAQVGPHFSVERAALLPVKDTRLNDRQIRKSRHVRFANGRRVSFGVALPIPIDRRRFEERLLLTQLAAVSLARPARCRDQRCRWGLRVRRNLAARLVRVLALSERLCDHAIEMRQEHLTSPRGKRTQWLAVDRHDAHYRRLGIRVELCRLSFQPLASVRLVSRDALARAIPALAPVSTEELRMGVESVLAEDAVCIASPENHR